MQREKYHFLDVLRYPSICLLACLHAAWTSESAFIWRHILQECTSDKSLVILQGINVPASNVIHEGTWHLKIVLNETALSQVHNLMILVLINYYRQLFIVAQFFFTWIVFDKA